MYQIVNAQLLTTVKLRATALETKARERTMAKVFMMILAGVCVSVGEGAWVRLML